jgi:periplasmic divalent cation tolerance protein
VIETADEVPLLIKTSSERYAALEAAIRQHHPYELPEVIALPIVHGLPEYLAWVAAETRPSD